MKIVKLLPAICLTVLMTSCGGWTDEESAEFSEICEKKNTPETCDCMKEMAQEKFSHYSDFKEDQATMAEILTDRGCLDTGKGE